MDKFVTMKLKNHTKYNKKILFVSVVCSDFVCNKSIIDEIANQYEEHLKNNTELSVILDARTLNFLNPKIAWEGANVLCRFNTLAKSNVLSSCLVINNKNIVNLINMIIKVHPLVVPFKIVKTNEEALNFFTENIKT